MARITEEEARRLGIPGYEAPPKRKNKHNNRKVWIDGICFDSEMEGRYYCQLKLLQRAGAIDGFCRQARFVVTEGKDDKRGVEYVTDFVIFYPDGTYRIVDVKGMKTETFKIKAKAFREKYPKLKLELEENV